MRNKEIYEKVNLALEKIRPYLQADGGGVRLVEITDDLIVKVELTGACDGCPHSMQTLNVGIAKGIKKLAPEVKEVIAINN